MTSDEITKAFHTFKTVVSGKAITKQDEEVIDIVFTLLEDMYKTQIKIMGAVTELAHKS